ncbi:hypothetical protein T12_14304 [Trichinella patagoniensis]|uniref:Uncharacterized protein n=1 Tax=Trichinella patagoniensis TaxID=990121 RepID=A0A0V1AFY4_9BILA|nr:hypothetical protein T12_14304 [Trichinella patagoniensis]
MYILNKHYSSSSTLYTFSYSVYGYGSTQVLNSTSQAKDRKVLGMGPDMEHGMWNMTIRFFNCGIDKNLYVEILYMMTLVCIIKWKTHVVLRITKEYTVQCCLLHDLFACDSNEFGLFGSKISLEVPVAAQFGLRAVAYISSHQVIEDFAVQKIARKGNIPIVA